ncbi:MAG: FRG domain-containing protein [Ilumatobacteraceae bacterium]
MGQASRGKSGTPKARTSAPSRLTIAPVQRRAIDRWSDFSQQLLELAVQRTPRRPGSSRLHHEIDHLDGRRFIFRGTRRADWQLESKFQRVWRDVTPNARAKIHGEQIKAFRAECIRYGVASEVCDSDTDLEAFGQHHGLPTRLLDWSLNPLVASFFAAADSLFHQSEQATHLVVHTLRTDSPVWSDQQEAVEIVSVSRKHNFRASRQHGVFTYDRSNSHDIESYLHSCDDSETREDLENNGPVLINFELPRSEAVTAIEEMDLYGVTFTSLFPDESGLAQSAQLRTILSSLRRPVMTQRSSTK